MAETRRAERDRVEQRRRGYHQVRRPSQGTWYERGPADQPQRARGRRSVPLQHQSYQGSRGYARENYTARRARGESPRAQERGKQGQAPRIAPQLTQVGRPVGGYGSASALEPRELLIRGAIVAVLLIVFIARIATFGGCAQSSALDTQIAEQQAQLEQLNEGNEQAQAQLTAMQDTIDSYDKLVSSSGSSSSGE